MQIGGIYYALMDVMTWEVEKSCHALKTAWTMRTMRRTMAKAKLEVLELGSGLSKGFPENDIKSCMWAGGGYQVMKKMILVANKRLPEATSEAFGGSIYPSGFLQTHSSLQRTIFFGNPLVVNTSNPSYVSFRPRGPLAR